MNRSKFTLLILILILSLVAGCERTDAQIAAGKLRHTLFVECMGLVAKIQRQSDDDVHKVVNACSTQASYMANNMRGKGND